RRYKVVANPKVYWHTKTLFHEEAEEEIWANVIDIGNHLIGLVSGPTGWRSHEHKTLNREYRAGIEARLLLLEPQMTFSFMHDCMSSLSRCKFGATYAGAGAAAPVNRSPHVRSSTNPPFSSLTSRAVRAHISPA